MRTSPIKSTVTAVGTVKWESFCGFQDDLEPRCDTSDWTWLKPVKSRQTGSHRASNAPLKWATIDTDTRPGTGPDKDGAVHLEIVSATLVFFLIMDPLGNVPLFLAVLKDVNPARHFAITLREVTIAYVALLVYLFAGRYILEFLGLSQEAIAISGGVILFLIALRMIFPSPQGILGGDHHGGEPLIVPLAIPAVAGPSIMAVLMLMATTEPLLPLFIAITVAWLATAAILLASTPLHRILGRRGLTAMERLMGMLLVMMSVEMMLDAVRSMELTT